MKASVVDLRYKMKSVLAALRRRETVEILYHGKTAGLIVPPPARRKTTDLRRHAFFGMHRGLTGSTQAVRREMERLRGGRYRAL